MSLIELRDITQQYMDKALYSDASLEVFGGEHLGVVGQNGTGKSTLIKIMAGEVIPDKGYVKRLQGLKLGYLDQYARIDPALTIYAYLKSAFADLYALERDMEGLYERSAALGDEKMLRKAANYQERLIRENFYALGSEIGKVSAGLGLDALGMDSLIGALSGGQRAKVILAKLLLQPADLLLLDEPTNFLDAEHVDGLAQYLTAFKGAFVTVSHDHDFLERISTGIIDVEFGAIKKYHGKYSEFLKQKTHLREDYVRQYNAQQKKIEITEAFIRKNIAGVNTKMAQGRRKQLERMEKLAPPAFTEKPVFRFSELPLPTHLALRVSGLEIGYYYPLLPKISFTVGAGELIVIRGFNGIGKSTLLKTLAGKLPGLSGEFSFAEQARCVYFEQDIRWLDGAGTPLEILMNRFPRHNGKELRKALARCGVKSEHMGRGISTLSGGEQCKVKLCEAGLTPANFLILDEPTNHLDAESKEALQEALRDFGGSVILVSHEEKFYKDLADAVFDVEKLIR